MICESVQRGMSSRAYPQGWFAPMEDVSLDIRALAAAAARASRDRSAMAASLRVRRRRARRPGQRDRVRARPARPSRARAGAVRARPRARRLPRHVSRILRHSYHTPDYVRLTFAAYDDWARLEHDSGEHARHRASAGSTCSRPEPPSRSTTTRRRMAACGVAYDALDAADVPADGRSSGCPTARWPSTRPTRRSCRRAAAPRVMQAQARRYGAVLRDEAPVLAIRDLRRRRRRGANRRT